MAAATSTERLGLGRVIETTFDVIYRDARILVPLAMLFVGLPNALVGWLQVTSGGPALAGSLLTLVTQVLLQGAVMHTVASNLNGRPRSIQAALSKSGQLLLPLIFLAVLMWMGVVMGLLLLIVPGVVLACIWSVALPARVVEGPDIFRAFGRSRALTKGYRGHIALLFLVYLIAVVVIGVVAGLTGIVGGHFFVEVILSPVVSAGTALIASAGAASLYYELRRIKEGAGPESLASIFA